MLESPVAYFEITNFFIVRTVSDVSTYFKPWNLVTLWKMGGVLPH